MPVGIKDGKNVLKRKNLKKK